MDQLQSKLNTFKTDLLKNGWKRTGHDDGSGWRIYRPLFGGEAIVSIVMSVRIEWYAGRWDAVYVDLYISGSSDVDVDVRMNNLYHEHVIANLGSLEDKLLAAWKVAFEMLKEEVQS